MGSTNGYRLSFCLDLPIEPGVRTRREKLLSSQSRIVRSCLEMDCLGLRSTLDKFLISIV